MKYLKLFESMFGPAEPKKISYEDFYPEKKPRDYFTEKELLYLESVFERNRIKIEDVEYNNRSNFIYNRFTSDKEELPDNFVIYMYSNGGNSNLICFDCYKHKDDWYYVRIFQGDDIFDEENTIDGFSEYYECDEFDSLKILLDKWL